MTRPIAWLTARCACWLYHSAPERVVLFLGLGFSDVASLFPFPNPPSTDEGVFSPAFAASRKSRFSLTAKNEWRVLETTSDQRLYRDFERTFWIEVWCKWQAGYNNCTAHVVGKVDSFGYFASTHTHEYASGAFWQANKLLEFSNCVIQI